MWKAEVYPLAILVALFSGIWPYIKLFLMIMCWIVPPHRFSYHKREILLEVLDTMGKYSLIDAYVLIYMIVSMKYHFNMDYFIFSIYMDEIVTPGFGYFAFLIGTITSLIWTHLIIHYHRM